MTEALIALSVIATTALAADTFLWMPKRKRVARERQKARTHQLERELEDQDAREAKERARIINDIRRRELIEANRKSNLEGLRRLNSPEDRAARLAEQPCEHAGCPIILQGGQRYCAAHENAAFIQLEQRRTEDDLRRMDERLDRHRHISGITS